MPRTLVGAVLVLIAGACAPHHARFEATGPRRTIAVVKVIEATGARLASVNGERVSSPSQIQLAPGDYTLVVRYAPQKKAATEELSFVAEAGHRYELSAASPEVAGGTWTPVLVDNSTQTQIHPKK